MISACRQSRPNAGVAGSRGWTAWRHDVTAPSGYRGEHAHVDEAGVIPVDQGGMSEVPIEVVGIEPLQRLQVLRLLDGEDIEFGANDPLRQ